MKFLLNMNKFIFLSPKEALLIHSSLSDYAVKVSSFLSHSDDYPSNVVEELLDDLDLCDFVRKKILKLFNFTDFD